MWRRGHLLTKFHGNPRIDSKVIAGTETHRQTGDPTNLLLLLNERLKTANIYRVQGTYPDRIWRLMFISQGYAALGGSVMKKR
jgi:hypothetical protein